VGWLFKRKPAGIPNPVRGQFQVVACSPFPDAGGEVILSPQCEVDGLPVLVDPDNHTRIIDDVARL
jgi:hypothetical protein